MGGVSVQLTIKAGSPVEAGPDRKYVWGRCRARSSRLNLSVQKMEGELGSEHPYLCACF